MYRIEFAQSAFRDLKALRRFGQQLVLDGIEARLADQPLIETANRKRLRPNEVADWELRLGKFRVLYNVDETAQVVIVQAIGYKIGNELYIRGEVRDL